MDSIREVYNMYNAKFVEKDVVDAILSKLPINIHKKGQVQYSEFISFKNLLSIDAIK